MSKLFALLLTALFSVGLVHAGDDEKNDIKIANYDEDGDGQLSRTEISARDDIAAQFEQLDANGDGKLSEDELDEGPIDDFDEIGEDTVEENEDW